MSRKHLIFIVFLALASAFGAGSPLAQERDGPSMRPMIHRNIEQKPVLCGLALEFSLSQGGHMLASLAIQPRMGSPAIASLIISARTPGEHGGQAIPISQAALILDGGREYEAQEMRAAHTIPGALVAIARDAGATAGLMRTIMEGGRGSLRVTMAGQERGFPITGSLGEAERQGLHRCLGDILGLT